MNVLISRMSPVSAAASSAPAGPSSACPEGPARHPTTSTTSSWPRATTRCSAVGRTGGSQRHHRRARKDESLVCAPPPPWRRWQDAQFIQGERPESDAIEIKRPFLAQVCRPDASVRHSSTSRPADLRYRGRGASPGALHRSSPPQSPRTRFLWWSSPAATRRTMTASNCS